MLQILVLHGPNLNLLGKREPEIYGYKTLDEVNNSLKAQALEGGFKLECKQTNHEGVLVDCIHQAAPDGVAFIIINAAAYTHTSIAIRDALKGVEIPFIEVHLSNINAREDFRRHSYLADIAQQVIMGHGVSSYELALQAAMQFVTEQIIEV